MISSRRAPAATICAETVSDLGVVLAFWKELVSVIIPVKRQVEISSSNGDLSGDSASSIEIYISAVEVELRSTKLTCPKKSLPG